MSSYYTTEAIILGQTDMGEADRKYIFYTRDFGRIDASARSVRLEKSKLRGHLRRFSRVRILFIGMRDGYLLIDADTISAYDMNAQELAAMSVFVAFLLTAILGTETDPALWNLLVSVFARRERFPSDENAVLALKAKALNILGMLPERGVKNEQDVRRVLMANHMI